MQWHLKPWTDLTRDELYRILGARAEVFVVEQKCAYLDVDGNDPLALHVWIEDDEQTVLGYLRIFAPAVKYADEACLGRILTTAPARKRGLGRALVHRGIQVVDERFPGAPIRIGAQVYLAHFYEELGFVKASASYLEDGIPHVEMLRAGGVPV